MDVQIPCVCGQHERDTITLRDTLDFRAAVTLRNEGIIARTNGATLGETLAVLSEQYLLVGITAWTLADARGRPLPVTAEAIRERILSRPEIAIDVAEAADDLYGEKVVLPLILKASSSSPPGPTDASTSARTSGPSSTPKRPSRSSTTSTRTGGTAATSTSLVGASST